MSTAPADSWNQARQLFADQFEPDGNGFIYRRSQKGEAIRVTVDEYKTFIDEFDRNVRRSKLIIYVGLAVILGGAILVSVAKGFDLKPPLMFAGISLVMVPYFVYYWWAWRAPVRALAGRVPIAGERSSDEVRRIRFQRITYGKLASAAAAGLALPFLLSGRQDLFSGWGRLWLVLGAALVLLVAVQAFRKWQIDQDPLPTYVGQRLTNSSTTDSSDDDSGLSTLGQRWRYALIAAAVVAFAVLFFTPAGRRLVQQPSFWLILMIVFGIYALVTVAQGFTKGQIEPLVRGMHSTYQRDTQPKRFWASMTWTGFFGCMCIWLAVMAGRDAGAEPLRNSCYNLDRSYSPKDELSACNRLIQLKPKDSNAYLDRGLIFLNAMKLDLAVADFSRAHELDPSSPWPVADRGISYAWKNDRDRAERDFKDVRSIDPLNPVVFRGEALLNLRSGNLEAAVDGLSAQLARHPDDRWSLRMRADAYQQMGDFDKATLDRDRLLRLSGSANAPRGS